MYLELESNLKKLPKFRPGDIVRIASKEKLMSEFGYKEDFEEDDDGKPYKYPRLITLDKDGVIDEEIYACSIKHLGKETMISCFDRFGERYEVAIDFTGYQYPENILELVKRESNLRFKKKDIVFFISVDIAKKRGIWKELSDKEKEILKNNEKTYCTIEDIAFYNKSYSDFKNEEINSVKYHYGYKVDSDFFYIKENVLVPDCFLLPDPIKAIKENDKEALDIYRTF